MKTLIRYLILAVFIFGLPLVKNEVKLGSYTTTTSVIGLLNSQRSASGRKPLIYSSKLANAAYRRAMQLAQNDQWSHAGFNTAVNAIATNNILYGENLGVDIPNNSVLVNMWMASPSHRQNILNSSYKYVGFARYENYAVVWFSQ